MANLKEFNFQHQTAVPFQSHPPQPPHVGVSGASELASSQKGEEEEIMSGVASMQGGRRLKTSKQNSLTTCRVTLVRLRPRGGSMASK